MRILITGASGFVGRHLVASLRRDGKSMTVLARGAASAGPDIFPGPADLADLGDWPDWPRNIDAIVHLAALNPGRRSPETPDALLHANAEGTAALARRARREGMRRIVFLSTANVHGPGPRPIRETDLLDPQGPYARSKAAAEAAFWRELKGGDTQGCVLRPAPVYGLGGRGNVAALVKLARLPIPLPIVGLGGTRSLVAVDHLVSAISHCLTADGAVGETFLVADEGPLTLADIVGALRRGWGRPERVFAPPAALRRQLEARLPQNGPLGTFILDTGHLAERMGWRSPETAAARLSGMAKSGEI